MNDKKYLRNDDFLCTVEKNAKRCLMRMSDTPKPETERSGQTGLDPSIALILIEEIRRLRTIEQLLGAGADYTQGYEDGWRDGRSAVPDEVPMAWAVIGRRKSQIKLVADKPDFIGQDETVVALYTRPQ